VRLGRVSVERGREGQCAHQGARLEARGARGQRSREPFSGQSRTLKRSDERDRNSTLAHRGARMTPRKGGTVTRRPHLATAPVAIAGLACTLFVTLGAAACGGKIAPTDVQDEDDAATPGECGVLDPTLNCGVDGCGNAVSAICRPTLWVCPPITPGCTMDASLADGASSSVGFVCGSGTCPPNTFCQDPSGTSPGACIPFPLECKRTPYTPSETCACLERRASQDRLCRPNRLLCPYPTANLNGVHIGCLPE